MRVVLLLLLSGCQALESYHQAIHQPCSEADAWLDKYQVCIFYDTPVAKMYGEDGLSPAKVEEALDVFHDFGLRRLLGMGITDDWLRYFYSNHGARIRFNSQMVEDIFPSTDTSHSHGVEVHTTEGDKFAVILKPRPRISLTAFTHEMLHVYLLIQVGPNADHHSVPMLFACEEAETISNTVEYQLQAELCWRLEDQECERNRPSICGPSVSLVH